jgi:hypothetical protein
MKLITKEERDKLPRQIGWVTPKVIDRLVAGPADETLGPRGKRHAAITEAIDEALDAEGYYDSEEQHYEAMWDVIDYLLDERERFKLNLERQQRRFVALRDAAEAVAQTGSK